MPLTESILKLLESKTPFALASILHQDGSTPRTAGARMIVLSSGEIEGTIGGGKVEALAIERAQEVISQNTPVLATFDLTGKKDEGVDMICGGRLEVLIEPMMNVDQLQPVFSACREAQKKQRPWIMVVSLNQTDGGLHIGRSFYVAQEVGSNIEALAAYDIPKKETADTLAQGVKGAVWDVVEKDGQRYLVESGIPRDTLYLFGGGHVAAWTAKVAAIVGFRVVVLDDRPEFSNFERFPDAERCLVPKTFDDIFTTPEMIDEPMGASSYVVIVTRGHRNDAEILEQALETQTGYLGMIGSRSKRDATYRALEEKGFDRSRFDRVHCPIGLTIGAQTPEEIGVSIVAEMIAHRAQLRTR
ncbi:XdhC family aldehyde oxidoreductase maturation factor [Desulfovibrio inopinatus]|uniref:XdhC family aldehyde oxidoreductase maturation factor n=1 Tax=Desulfovibrio inopinatus TaxID=102109 RepID=UPI00040EE549|nr:XdhC/CoxI family protein [Desulfovibrio inopinatus]